jgi:hypothetical protein
MIFSHEFKNDLELINNELLNKRPFAFSKYADGEYFILQNKPIRNIDNWFFDPNLDQRFMNMLRDSLAYKDDGYYVGISCPCCHKESYDWFLQTVGSDYGNTTFANIFVNSNYPYYLDQLIPTFNTYGNIYLVCNGRSNKEKIKQKLNVTDFFGIGDEAFKTDLHLIDDLLNFVNQNNIKGALFLFSAGPFGNVLAHKLWENNKNNTYLDIGSTLNTLTDLNIRDYQSNGHYSNKTCIFQ